MAAARVIVQMIEISQIWRRCGDYPALGLRPPQRMNFVERKVTTVKSKYTRLKILHNWRHIKTSPTTNSHTSFIYMVASTLTNSMAVTPSVHSSWLHTYSSTSTCCAKANYAIIPGNNVQTLCCRFFVLQYFRRTSTLRKSFNPKIFPSKISHKEKFPNYGRILSQVKAAAPLDALEPAVPIWFTMVEPVFSQVEWHLNVWLHDSRSTNIISTLYLARVTNYYFPTSSGKPCIATRLKTP